MDQLKSNEKALGNYENLSSENKEKFSSLAEKLYVTRQTVSRWESGNRYPDLETLKKISVELEVSVDELLSIEPHPDEQKEMTAEEEKTTEK